MKIKTKIKKDGAKHLFRFIRPEQILEDQEFIEAAEAILEEFDQNFQ